MGQRRETSEIFEVNEIESTTYQNLWNEVKNSGKREFITLSTYITKGERSKINSLNSF